jgi:peptide/nickel transport system ATP-binding protein
MDIKNVRAYYQSAVGPEVKAVDDISLTIRDGEVLGIAGESGCGKSTLAAVMSMTARAPLLVKSGEMTLNGDRVDLTRTQSVTSDWHGRMVALLPQRAMNSLNPTARVRDFVVDVMRAHDRTITPQQAVEHARLRLEQLGLPARALDAYPHQLSGGMRQRVVAVVSTLLDPQLLIADEPTSALDVSSQKQLVILLKLLLERRVINSIAFITHDLPMLSNFADRIVVMYAGKIAEIGDTEQIVNDPQHPYTSALIGSTLDPEPGVRDQRLEGIPGAPPDLRYPPPGCPYHPRCQYAMQICREEFPPAVGPNPHDYANCWWVADKAGMEFEHKEPI